MPYINQSKREDLNPAIDQIINTLRGLESDDPENDTEGNINYVISSMLSKIYPGARYAEINAAMGIGGFSLKAFAGPAFHGRTKCEAL